MIARRISLKSNFLFLIVYGIYAFFRILNLSLVEVPNGVMNLVRYSSISLLILLCFINSVCNRIKLRNMLIIVGLIVLFTIAAVKTSDVNILIFALLIIDSGITTIEKIIKSSLVSVLCALFLVEMTMLMGGIDNLRYISEDGLREGYCLGFGYYSTVSFIVMFCSIMYVYLMKEKCSWIRLGLILVINYMIYRITTTRLSWYLIIIFILLYILIIKFNWPENISSKVMINLTTFAFPAGIVITYLTMALYTTSNYWWVLINMILNGRLTYMHRGYLQYPIKLFGQYVYMEGNNLTRANRTIHFYIDSGFAYSLLAYGLLFSLFVTFLYTVIYRYSIKSNNKMLFIWITIVFIFSFLNNAWVNLHYNPILMVIFPALKASIETIKRVKITKKGRGQIGAFYNI